MKNISRIKQDWLTLHSWQRSCASLPSMTLKQLELLEDSPWKHLRLWTITWRWRCPKTFRTRSAGLPCRGEGGMFLHAPVWIMEDEEYKKVLLFFYIFTQPIKNKADFLSSMRTTYIAVKINICSLDSTAGCEALKPRDHESVNLFNSFKPKGCHLQNILIIVYHVSICSTDNSGN